MLENLRVLCVDDEAAIARSLARIVKNKRAISREAHNVQEALTAIGEFYPNVVITDLKMPECAGGSDYDIAGLLLAAKAKEVSPKIKVILYTARSKDDIGTDIELFVDGYIQKPSRKEIILRDISRALTSSSRRKAAIVAISDAAQERRAVEEWQKKGYTVHIPYEDALDSLGVELLKEQIESRYDEVVVVTK